MSGLLAGGEEHLDISALETWLWDAACKIRGATDAPKFKDFILPLIFYKRLSDVYDDELLKHANRYGSIELARQIVEQHGGRIWVEPAAPCGWRFAFVIPLSPADLHDCLPCRGGQRTAS